MISDKKRLEIANICYANVAGVFAQGHTCEETMAELAKTCKEQFGVA
jgi:hypothetical protein